MRLKIKITPFVAGLSNHEQDVHICSFARSPFDKLKANGLIFS